MSKKVFLVPMILFLLSACLMGENLNRSGDIIIGSRFSMESKILGEERSFSVFLPDGYSKSTESFPVFFLLDGDMHFHHVSGIIQVLSKFSHIPPMILVAVHNVERERDFIPTRVNDWPLKAESGKFRAFLKTELIPVVEKNYRVRPFRILCGHSFGGMFCIETFLKDPDLFTVFIAISGSLDWDNNLLLKLAEENVKHFSFNRKFLFLSNSADELTSITGIKAFVRLLEETSPRGLEWRFDYLEHDDHLSVVHPTIYNVLRWLHQGWRLSEADLGKMTLEEVIDHYDKLSGRYGSKVRIPEGVLFNLGYAFLDKGMNRQTKETFEYAIRLYPDLPASYVGLGELYDSTGDLELARKNLEIALYLAEKQKDHMVLPIAKGLLEKVTKKISDRSK